MSEKRESFMLYDPLTESRASGNSWPSKASALHQRDQWIIRCDKGGRPDISRAMIERLVALPSVHKEKATRPKGVTL